MCSRSIRPDSAGPAPFRAEQQVFRERLPLHSQWRVEGSHTGGLAQMRIAR
jgi:hypothetical protein